MNEHTNETPRGRYLATLHAELESVFKTFLSHACIADKQLIAPHVHIDHSNRLSDEELSLIGAFMLQITGSVD
jgi:hypothetical protein